MRYVPAVSANLAAIGMVTRDLGESVRFYRALGLDIPEPDGDHLDVTLPSGVRLMWDTEELVRGMDPDWLPPQGQGMTLAFECAAPSEVDALHTGLTEAGFHSKRDPWDAFWGQRYAQIYDPDGYAVDLFAPLPQDA